MSQERRAAPRSEMDNINAKLTPIYNLLREQGAQIVEIKTRVDRELASREWVTSELSVMKEASLRTEHAIESLGEKLEAIVASQEKLYTSHNELMKQRGENEKRESDARIAAAEKRTLMALIKDIGQPLLAFIVIVSVVIALAMSALVSYLNTQGYVRTDPVKAPTHVQVAPRSGR